MVLPRWREIVQLANSLIWPCKERYSTSLITEEIQVRTKRKGYFTASRMDSIKTTQKIKRALRLWRNLTIRIHCWWEIAMRQTLWKAVWNFHWKLKIISVLCNNSTLTQIKQMKADYWYKKLVHEADYWYKIVAWMLVTALFIREKWGRSPNPHQLMTVELIMCTCIA